MVGRTDRLASLNPIERRILALLANGHTAKTIAARLGLSVNAVNERLRTARGKTGAGSSRELARQLAAQENRDEQIGMEPHTRGDDATRGMQTVALRRRQFPWSMIAMITGAVIGTALWLAGPQQPVPVAPTDVPHLRLALAAEQRDARWAEDAEQKLGAIYAPVRGVGPVTVRCASSLCEVSAEIAADMQSSVAEALQASELAAELRAAGFADQPLISFFADKGRSVPGQFVTFWRRLASSAEPDRSPRRRR